MAPKRIVALAVGLVLFAASLAYIVLTFQWRAVLDAFRIAQPAWFLLGGSAAVLGYWLTRALRWHYLIRGLQPGPGFLDLYLCSSTALGLSVLTPLQSGEALKVELLRAYGGPARLPGYTTFVVERSADLYVVTAMAAWALVSPLVLPFFILLPFAAVLVLRRDFLAPSKLTILLALTTLGWVIVALGWQACLLSLSIQLAFTDLLGLVSLVSLASTLSFVPAGLGIADASAAALMIRYGVDAPLAQAGAVLLRAFTPLVLVLGMLHLAWLRGRKRRAL